MHLNIRGGADHLSGKMQQCGVVGSMVCDAWYSTRRLCASCLGMVGIDSTMILHFGSAYEIYSDCILMFLVMLAAISLIRLYVI